MTHPLRIARPGTHRALHVLSPDFDPIQRPTSEYALGPFGYMNLVSRRLGRDARWRPIQRIARPVALVVIVEFVVGGLAVATETGAGIAQRILLVTFSAWFILVAARLLSNAREHMG